MESSTPLSEKEIFRSEIRTLYFDDPQLLDAYKLALDEFTDEDFTIPKVRQHVEVSLGVLLGEYLGEDILDMRFTS